MLRYSERWSVFDAPVQTIVNTVNCDGVMGKGLALEVKRRFPEAFQKYQEICKRGQMQVGKLQLIRTVSPWVLNFPTKNHWRGKSQLDYIEKGLRKFISTYKRRGITSIAFPPLGCGSGGLQWEDVRPLMEKYLSKLVGIAIYVCLAKPQGTPLATSRRRRVRKNGKKGSHRNQLGLLFPPTTPS
jgi:O-acetyl-ADP-ribose deacetylase (regulator of RNase III)